MMVFREGTRLCASQFHAKNRIEYITSSAVLPSAKVVQHLMDLHNTNKNIYRC